jgi:cytochrome c556
MTKTRLLLVGSALLAGAVTVQAEEKADPKKDAIKYRQAAMTLIGANFKPMGAMVKGDVPFNAQEFARRSKDVAAISSIDVLAAFPQDTDGAGSKAKPEIWMKWDDFKKKMGDMERETAKLAEVAKGGDAAAIKKQFGETGKTCKACHDDYKE